MKTYNEFSIEELRAEKQKLENERQEIHEALKQIERKIDLWFQSQAGAGIRGEEG